MITIKVTHTMDVDGDNDDGLDPWEIKTSSSFKKRSFPDDVPEIECLITILRSGLFTTPPWLFLAATIFVLDEIEGTKGVRAELGSSVAKMVAAADAVIRMVNRGISTMAKP